MCPECAARANERALLLRDLSNLVTKFRAFHDLGPAEPNTWDDAADWLEELLIGKEESEGRL